MQYFSRIALVLGAFMLVACDEVKLEDGRIPADYLDEARLVAGTYSGTMDGRMVQLEFKLEGDRLLVSSRPDFLGEGCESQFGLLQAVKAEREGNGYRIESARYAFAPNRCELSVAGREVIFGLRTRNGQTELNAALLRESRWERECRIVCSPAGPGGGVNCREECTMRPVQVYLNGRFYKR